MKRFFAQLSVVTWLLIGLSLGGMLALILSGVSL